MKTFLKVLAALLVALLVASASAFIYFNEPEPEGRAGEAADQMAQRMLAAINDSAWNATRYVQWSFRNGNHYLWDKQSNIVRVQWEETTVVLDANTVAGVAHNGTALLSGTDADDAVQKAWKSFCNDGFWVYAPYKVFDAGTVRSIVALEDGTEALKVTYMQGGVTPGDSYVWILDQTGRPKAWKLWVKIIPIGGATFTWDNWVQLPTGAWIATAHHSALLDVPITDLRGAQTLEELGLPKSVFLE